MKRIAYLLADFPILSETFVGNEIRAMRAHGHTVLPIIMRRSHGPAQPEDVLLAKDGVALCDLPRGLAVLPELLSPNLRPALAFLRDQACLPARSLLYQGARIASLLRKERIEHVHAHFAGGAAAHAIFAARLAGASVSFVCHGHDVYAEPEDLAAKLAHIDFAVAVCQDLRHDLQAISPKARIVDVPCGTNIARFMMRQRPDHNGRLLFVGRLVEQKGLDDLLRALAAIPVHARMPLDLVGDGPLRTPLKDLAQNLGLRPQDLTFLGAKPASWFAEHGADYCGLVAPFKCAPDGARDTGPLVVKEAMALGLPVVSTAFMGVKETITSETGFLVPPAAPSALAAAILEVMRLDISARQRLAKAARARVEQLFTLEQSAFLLSQAMEQA